ncbi:TolC family protein [uncultured Draconibacterium sp.]|uniref:TolC family protein n=1 Tax=uncultured Draconibacterium sp. TaxID=1573823 RepID=UPI0025DF9DF0|nr:TolC family protein [uncultured Draconibacterium sp.]
MNQSIKYITSTLVVFLLVFGKTHGQKVMTLEECRQQAVEYNKELKKAVLQNKEALVNQEVARTAYLPSISGSLTGMYVPGVDVDLSGGGFLPTAESEAAALAGDFGTSNIWSPGFPLAIDNLSLIYGGLSVEQPVYAGGRIKYSNQQADAGVSIAGHALNLKYSEIIENTDQAFWNVVTVEENIKTAREYIKMLEELEEQMRAMYEVGLQPASEKLRVSVQKNEAELNLVKANNGLKIAKMYLNQILGQPLDTDINVSHNVGADVLLFDLADGVTQAINQRSEIKILEKQKEISELDAKITRADYLPTVGVSAQYTNFYINDLNESFDPQPMLAASVSIPIFQWGQGKKKQRAAQLRIEQAQTDLVHTNDLINLEVMQVRVQVEEAYESIKIAKKSVDEAAESMAETKASFEVGLNTTTDMLNAQAQWAAAKSQLIQAVAGFKVLETKWERVTGNLYAPDGEPVSQLQ